MANVRLLVVIGPTASGKSALALRIAEAAGAEIVSADSQQVYCGLNIGTGKVGAEDRARIPHHLIDVVSPAETMTAARFAELADAAIADAAARGRPIVVAGGTGLYVRALLYGLFEGPGANAEVRTRLEEEGLESLYRRLQDIDPAAAARILPNDLRRIVRALEVFELTGETITVHQQRHAAARRPRYTAQTIGLEPARAELHARIAARVGSMLAAGWIDEVRSLASAGFSLDLRAFDAIGYREIRSHLRGELSANALPELIIPATRRYARRQLAWFRAEPQVTWYKSADEADPNALAAWLRAEGQ